MNRYAFYGQVKPEMIEEYRRRHREVWPEMLDALSASGFHNYSLYLREDGLLFGYVESPDIEAALKAMSNTEVNARWQKEMSPFFQIPEGKHPDKAFIFMEEIFHLE